jgi:hypothetical protein
LNWTLEAIFAVMMVLPVLGLLVKK